MTPRSPPVKSRVERQGTGGVGGPEGQGLQGRRGRSGPRVQVAKPRPHAFYFKPGPECEMTPSR